MKGFVRIALCLWVFALASVAHAQTSPQTTTFQVTATVVKSCSIDSASTLAFGNYNPISSTPLDQTSSIVVRCTNGTPYTLALNGGTTTGGTIAGRLMTTGAVNTLSYQLYTNSGRTTVWGDGTLGSSTVTGTGTGVLVANEQTLTVYGRIPINQTSAIGTYSDTITATLTF